jgi:hypothetical protein
MVEIFDNVLTPAEIKTLLGYYYKEDCFVDDRLDVRSKTPNWTDTEWPGHLVKQVLDQVLQDDYSVEVVLFYGSRISFKLHVDSGNGDDRPLFKNVLIPLHTEGPASTVLFDNYWSGPHTRFGRIPVSPFAYSLPGHDGKLKSIADIRVFLEQCKQEPNKVTDFKVTDEFVTALEHIVIARSSNTRPPDDYITDYKDVVNYRSDTKFDSQLHKQHLNHIPIENLHGLTIDQVIPWQVGQAYTFDRNQLHAAGAGHDFKIGISIFTYCY